MEHLFSNSSDEEDNNYSDKINLDELYDKKYREQQYRISVYKKILNRIHTKIKTTARQRNSSPYLFYVVPEVLLGISKYNINECLEFVIDKLTDNGFNVKYTHPNLLFISWVNYIPSYKRKEIRDKTGKNIDGFGNIIKKKNTLEFNNGKKLEDNGDINNLLLNMNLGSTNNSKNSKNNKNIKSPKKNNENYRDISTYKKIGIYNSDIFSKLNEKLDS
jgi:hypothetical protein